MELICAEKINPSEDVQLLSHDCAENKCVFPLGTVSPAMCFAVSEGEKVKEAAMS